MFWEKKFFYFFRIFLLTNWWGLCYNKIPGRANVPGRPQNEIENGRRLTALHPTRPKWTLGSCPRLGNPHSIRGRPTEFHWSLFSPLLWYYYSTVCFICQEEILTFLREFPKCFQLRRLCPSSCFCCVLHRQTEHQGECGRNFPLECRKGQW